MANEAFVNFILTMKKQADEVKAIPGARWRIKQEKRMAKRLDSIFERQMKFVVDEIANFEVFQKGFRYVSRKQYESEISQLIASIPLRDVLVDVLTDYMGLAMVRGANEQIRANDLQEFGVSFTLSSPAAIAFIDTRREFELSNFRGTISSVTNQKIVKIVQDGLRNGLTYTEMANQIRQQGTAGVFSHARSVMISQMEIGRAYGRGEFNVWKDYMARTGREVKKEWITVGDDKVRESHRLNEKQGKVSLYNRFQGTGDEIAPSEYDFNCRCTMGFAIE